MPRNYLATLAKSVIEADTLAARMPNIRPFRFDPEKALQVILYLATKAAIPDIIHVCKCLYFADKKHLEQVGRFICGDNYIAMTNGPVPSGTYDLIRDVKDPNRRSLWADDARSTFGLQGWRIMPLAQPDTSVFSKNELASLDWAIENYSALTARQLIDISHEEKAYKEADPNGDISIEAIARSLPDADLLLEHLRDPDPARELEPA